MANNNGVRDIDKEAAVLLLQKTSESDPIHPKTRTITMKVHVYKQGKGPIDIIKMGLAGWDQDQFEVREIMDKYGFKSMYTFTPGFGRGVPIQFNLRNGRSLLQGRCRYLC
ncbi:mitochondrial import inner membrane translocase [Striga asiatica]|uniref:Mitochondrial import inner membrane translocase n=1 Tax=Striga asiatica TaxID=4170 RepID=A0A5A7QQY9_STRAF|nr:mitochondrial import inner membrane translocase [Striga asiatica]